MEYFEGLFFFNTLRYTPQYFEVLNSPLITLHWSYSAVLLNTSQYCEVFHSTMQYYYSVPQNTGVIRVLQRILKNNQRTVPQRDSEILWTNLRYFAVL